MSKMFFLNGGSDTLCLKSSPNDVEYDWMIQECNRLQPLLTEPLSLLELKQAWVHVSKLSFYFNHSFVADVSSSLKK